MEQKHSGEGNENMKAQFIGKTSMGFKTGQIYELKSKLKIIRRDPPSIFCTSSSFTQPCICLYDTKSEAWCPYSSLEAVFQNWRFL